jgi:hypothetical protein
MDADQQAAAIAQQAAAFAQMQQQLQQAQQQIQQQQAAHAHDVQVMHDMQAQRQNDLAAQVQLQQQLLAQMQPQPQQQQQQPPRAAHVRVMPHMEFEGRVGALDAWVASMRQQFDYHGLASDSDQIKLSAATFRGPALEWYQALGAVPQQWAALVSELRKRFQPLDNSVSARANILALRQGTGSVADYVSKFRRLLIAVPDMSAKDRLFQFARGLSQRLQEVLETQDVQTYEEAEAMAVRVGAHPSRAQQLPPPSSSAPAAAAAGGSSSMDLDNIEGLDQETSSKAPATMPSALEQILAAITSNRSSSSSGGGSRGGRFRPYNEQAPRPPGYIPRVPHLTEEQVKLRMKAGECFGCKSTGHGSRQCPKRVVDANGRTSWPQAN